MSELSASPGVRVEEEQTITPLGPEALMDRVLKLTPMSAMIGLALYSIMVMIPRMQEHDDARTVKLVDSHRQLGSEIGTKLDANSALAREQRDAFRELSWDMRAMHGIRQAAPVKDGGK